MDNQLTLFAACNFACCFDCFALSNMRGKGADVAFLSDDPPLVSKYNVDIDSFRHYNSVRWREDNGSG